MISSLKAISFVAHNNTIGYKMYEINTQSFGKHLRYMRNRKKNKHLYIYFTHHENETPIFFTTLTIIIFPRNI